MLESGFQFLDFSTAEFQKKSNWNLWNQKRNWNSASDGGPRNWNQKLEFPAKVPHILMDPQGLYQRNMGLIIVMSEYGIQPSTKQTHPRLLMLTERCKYFEFGLTQSSMVCCPWLSKYVSIMSANSEVTVA
jgi:hypothetical protein